MESHKAQRDTVHHNKQTCLATATTPQKPIQFDQDD